ncbi:VF530 family protein [Enterovibrio sp. NIFS-20-8]|nr:VF530 family protein [Enterovibrio paralichthyis]
MNHQPNNPLHGVKLEQIINQLVEHYGWQYLGREIAINCFRSDPSVKSSLKFLRKTPWAREKVEQLYLDTFCQSQPDVDPWAASLNKLKN